MKKITTILLLFISLLAYPQGSEMITNGGFTDATGWTFNASNWSVSDGAAHFLDVATDRLYQYDDDMVSSIAPNTEYIISFDISDCDRNPYTDQAYWGLASTDGITYIAGTYYRENKTHEIVFRTPADIGDGGIRMIGSAPLGGSYTLDNVSLKTVDAVTAGNKYIDPAGHDYDPGDITNPFRTLQRAFQTAEPGDTVFFRDGTYYLEGTQKHLPESGIGNDGTEANRIVFMSYPGEWAIFDGSNLCEWQTANSNNDVYNIAINVSYSAYLTFKNFELRNVYGCPCNSDVHAYAFDVRPLYKCDFEHIIIHQLGVGGISTQSGAWKSSYEAGRTAAAPKWDTDIDTLRFTNMDVYECMDSLAATPGSDANPWQSYGYEGNVLIWEGCRVWNYAGDGNQASGGEGAKRIWNRCWFMPSKKYAWGSGYEGNALKYGWNLGLYGIIRQPENNMAEITNCVAMFCGDYAFRALEPNKGIFYNNTIYSATIGISKGKTNDTIPDHSVYKNNISYGITGKWGGVYTYWASIQGLPYTESHNTWDYDAESPVYAVLTDTVTVTDADFVTLDSLTLVTKFTAARQADGSLPVDAPLQLAEGSDLINAGIGVGLIYDGRAYTFDDDTISMGYLQYAGVAPAEGGGTPPLDDEEDPPSVTTLSATYNAVSANVTGQITSDGGGTLTARGICWSTSTVNPTLSNKHTTYSPYVGTFTDKIYGLRGGVTYYFRAYATTSEGGTSYGGTVSVTTPAHSIINNSSTGRVYTIGGVPIIIR